MDETSEELEDNIADVALDAVILLAWASKNPGKAKNVIPIKKELKQGVGPVRASQYPIRLEAHKGLEPLLNTFVQYGLLRECQSEFGTSHHTKPLHLAGLST